MKLAAAGDDRGWIAIAGFFGASIAGAFAAPGLLNYAFPLLAGAMTTWLLLRHRPANAVELIIWLYIAGAFIRRLVDWRNGFHDPSPVLLAGPIASMCAVMGAWRNRRIPPVPALGLFVVSVAFCYAAIIGSLYNGPAAAVTSICQWVSPFCVGLLMMFTADERPHYIAMLRRVAAGGSLALGAYGIFQFLALPAWDEYWMTSVRPLLATIGSPEPLHVRVFSLGNSPGPMAALLTILLLMYLAERHRAEWAISLIGLSTLGLSLVRAAWIAFVVALLILVLARRVDNGRVLRIVGTAIVLLVTIGGVVASTIIDRFTETSDAGVDDTSLQDRLSFQAAQVPTAIRNGLGLGFGSTGTATRAADAGSAFANTDSGYLEILRTFGSVLAIVMIVLLVVLACSVWRRALKLDTRQDGAVVVALAASTLLLPVNLLFSPTIQAGTGVFFWASLALVLTEADVRPQVLPALAQYQ